MAQQEFPYSGSQYVFQIRSILALSENGFTDLFCLHRWCFGKGLDEFAPIGPVLVSPKILDTADLKVQSRLNGKDWQSDRTEAMIHTIPDIIAHFSIGTTLEAGDVIMTGTPSGRPLFYWAI